MVNFGISFGTVGHTGNVYKWTLTDPEDPVITVRCRDSLISVFTEEINHSVILRDRRVQLQVITGRMRWGCSGDKTSCT